MLGTQLHWVEGPWRGRLAMAARPRGGEWLADEAAWWSKRGVATVLSLPEKHEEQDLELGAERKEIEDHDMRFVSFPIADRGMPESEAALGKVLDGLHQDLRAGKGVVLHCRQGIGRTGLVAACLLMVEGLNLHEAIDRLTLARGVEVPETSEQRDWIAHFAQTLATAR